MAEFDNLLAMHGVTLVFCASDEDHRRALDWLRSRLNGAGIEHKVMRSNGSAGGVVYSNTDDHYVVESGPLDVRGWYTLEVRSDHEELPGWLRECNKMC